MPVIIGLFIGRWSSVVNVKLTEEVGQWTDDGGQRAERYRIRNAEFGMIEHGAWRIGRKA